MAIEIRKHPGYQINRPFWNGEDIRDRTILLHAEQGFGDNLQFIRFAPLVKRTRRPGAGALSSTAAPAASPAATGSTWLSTRLIRAGLPCPRPIAEPAGHLRHNA